MDFVATNAQVPEHTMMVRFVFIVLTFLLLLADQGFAQADDQRKISKRAKKNYELAMQQVDFGDYTKALAFLEEALQTDANYVDALLSKAGILSELKRYALAVDFYEKAFVVDEVSSKEYLFVYSIALGGLGEFKKALHAVNRFLALPNLHATSIQAARYRKKCFEFAVTLQELHPERKNLQVIHMGDSINSSVSEYYPTMTIDGSELIITRRTRNAADEDFYSSSKVEGIWSIAKPLKGKVNTLLKEGGQQITPDGKSMVFSAKDYPEGLGSFDIYLSFLTENGWSERLHAGTTVNTEYWESAPCLSPDKKQLYFSSDRPGGYGGTDLYVSTLLANGKWSRALNLGPTINTPGDESCPFMHADNQTLYFNSNGHLGYGGTDLYLSQKTLEGFSAPQNLGYPINTIDDEGSLFVASDALTGFLASDRVDSKGGLDIYSIQLYDGIKPSACSWLTGRVYDSLTNAGLSGLVEVIDLTTQQVVSAISAEEDGSYLAVLPAGKNYALNVSKKGYLFYSGRFIMKETVSQQSLKYNIPLQLLQQGTKIVLKNIQFASGSFELLPESYIELDKLVNLLSENPKLRVQIAGHTDNVGSEQDNLKLSNQRAKVVFAYLNEKQIAADRVMAKGFGAQEPIADNNTPNGRALNRRTEMLILSNN